MQTFKNILNYTLFKKGPLTSQALECMAFLRTKNCTLPEGIPDLQLHFLSGHFDDPALEKRVMGIETSWDHNPEYG